jgi:hypothetical protein
MRSLPRWLRVAIYSSFGALWVSGLVISTLKHFFRVAGEFGSMPHPWQPKVLVVHGIVAVIAIYFFGWISAQHVGDAWRRGVSRASGTWLVVLIAALALSGFAAFFLVDESIRSVNGLMHEFAGLALAFPWFAHWLTGRGPVSRPVHDRRRRHGHPRRSGV